MPSLSCPLSFPCLQCPFTPDPSRRQGSPGLPGVQTCGNWIRWGSGGNPRAVQRRHLLWVGAQVLDLGECPYVLGVCIWCLGLYVVCICSVCVSM